MVHNLWMQVAFAGSLQPVYEKEGGSPPPSGLQNVFSSKVKTCAVDSKYSYCQDY
jgi:hypothetical protein